MAIFHLDLRQIKRQTKSGKIKKVDAIVAYRERIKIGDFNYSKKNDFVESFCLFPVNFENSEYAINLRNPEFFANEIEKIERRKDSQLFDELIIALPKELTLEQNKQIITEFLTVHYISQDQMARICLHQSPNNLHCHILLPQRPLISENGNIKFGKKIRQEFSKFGKPKSADKLIKMRSDWAEIVNNKLAEIGSTDKISHLSIKNRRTEAMKNGDLEQAAKFDRPAIYLPNSAYSPKFKLITQQNDRFLPDIEKMEQARKFYAKRHDLESYAWDDLLAEREFWEELEQKDRIKIGVGLNAIKKMLNRLFKINEINKLTELKNDEQGRAGNSKKNTTTDYDCDQPNIKSIIDAVQRTSELIFNNLPPSFGYSRNDDSQNVPRPNGIDYDLDRNEQINQGIIRKNPLAIAKPSNYWGNRRHSGGSTGQGIAPSYVPKPQRRRRI